MDFSTHMRDFLDKIVSVHGDFVKMEDKESGEDLDDDFETTNQNKAVDDDGNIYRERLGSTDDSPDTLNYLEVDNINLVSSSVLFKSKLADWLFPADIPKEAQLWRLENIAIPFSYLLVGTFQGLSGGVLTIYLLQMGATEAQQITVQTLRALPSTFKILFGFLSDTTPLFGYRRKTYMLLGWLLSSISILVLAAVETPSIALLSTFYFLFGSGFWFADVIADSLMAEKARIEPESRRGELNSLCYACRFFALMISTVVATYAVESNSGRAVFLAMGILPWLLMVPSIWAMHEAKDAAVSSVSSQCSEIWSTLCSRAVWQPMAFVYLYNLLQVGNAAWTQYMYTSLKFTALEINSFSVCATVLLYLGVMYYRSYLLSWSWRTVFILSSSLNVFFSVLQILLLLKVNRAAGISDYLFSFGDGAMADFVAGVQFLPITLMMTNLCPKGSEGASYAMFTTINNSAMLVSSALSTAMLGLWDVSPDALARDDMRGMINLTVLTTVVQTSAVLLVGLLPRGVDDLRKLSFTAKSQAGAAAFLVVIGLSVLYAIVSNVLNILLPGWAGG